MRACRSKMPFSSVGGRNRIDEGLDRIEALAHVREFLPRERFLQRDRSPARVELRVLGRGEVRRDIGRQEGVSLDGRGDITPERAVGAAAAVLGAHELRPIGGQVVAIDSREEQLHAPPARDRGIRLLRLREGALRDLQRLLELLHLR